MWDLIVSVPDHCLSFYFGGIPMKEFVALRPKMYNFMYHKNDKYVKKKDVKTFRKYL